MHTPFGEDDLPRYATSAALDELVRACHTRDPLASDLEAVFKVILAPTDGALISRDIHSARMRHCQFIDSVVTLPNSSGVFKVSSPFETSLCTLLQSSPAAILVKETAMPIRETLERLERELHLRLSFSWMLPSKPAGRRVAVVGGRAPLDISRGSYASSGPFDAARSLGISITVLDYPHHWLRDDCYAHLRDDFIPLDLSIDAGLAERIAAAIDGHGFDGIVTFSDALVVATAQAAEMLSLPSEPLGAILQAHDKQKTRDVLGCDGFEALWLSSDDDLDCPITAGKLQSLQYPIVMKPSRGSGSTGVKKVNDSTSLVQAVQQLRQSRAGQHGILLETYISGPEVDANFVLWDGQLLFAEISDDFPCKADTPESTVEDDFAETLMVSPSQLPPSELELIRSSLYQNLVQLGFRSGVFHVEARVLNSSRRYQPSAGLVDLAYAGDVGDAKPKVFLIEVNARQPGLSALFSTFYTYGVNYDALRLLRAIGDRERFVAMAQPFKDLTQYHCGNCHISVPRANTVVPDDFFGTLFARIPEIVPHVSRAELLTQPGKTISPQGGSWFIGYVLVHSRLGRGHVVEMCNRIKDVADLVLCQ